MNRNVVNIFKIDAIYTFCNKILKPFIETPNSEDTSFSLNSNWQEMQKPRLLRKPQLKEEKQIGKLGPCPSSRPFLQVKGSAKPWRIMG